MKIVSKRILKKIYKKRNPWSHKYDYGHLLVVGGSKHYSGSPAFNTLAALRAGVDLVTVVAPKRAADIVASFKPDLIAYPLDCDYFSSSVLDEVLRLVKAKTAVVIGGGMGRKEETLEFIRQFLSRISLPTVIDADAIHAIANHMEIIKGKKVVLTPHAYEFFVLTNTKLDSNLKKRVEAVKNFANKWKVTVLLKGHVDVISDGKQTAINRTGSPYMTKGGLGDCLAGIVGALLARGIPPMEAASAAAWINGKAGEIVARKLRDSLITPDVIEAIPRVIQI